MRNTRFTPALKALLAALLLLGMPGRPAMAQQGQTVALTGALDGSADGIDFGLVTLRINGSPVPLDPWGRFAVRLPQAATYQLEIGGGAVFTMVQTFGGMELDDPACACLKVPAIELVARKEGRVELFFAGDTMAGRRFFEPDNGRPPLLRRESIDADLDALLAPMQPYFRHSDLASVNLETVLADEAPGPSPGKSIVFYSPTALAGALKRAGIDYVSLGNNHTYDYLEKGLDQTRALLDSIGIDHSGSGAHIDEAKVPERLDLGGHRLSLLGFVGWEGRVAPNLVATEEKGGSMYGNDANIAAGVAEEKRRGRVPIMQMHTGSEYSDEPSLFSIRRMRLAIDRGAALVASHHPHVPQGLEVHKNRLIAYSMGNFMFDQNIPETMISFTLKVWMEQGRVFRAEVIPIQILDYRPVPALGTMREALLRRVFALSARRDTRLTMSGGHGVIRLDGSHALPGTSAPSTACQADGLGLVRRRLELAQVSRECSLPASGRFGRDLIMRGDFENARYAAALDRTWSTRNAGWEIRTDANGNQHLALLPERAGQTTMLFPDPYFRKAEGRNYSLVADIRLERPARIELSLKDRPAKGAPATSAWKGGPVLGAIELPAAPGWQRIRIDFTRLFAAGEVAPGMRPILAFTYLDGKAAGTATIAIDNLSLIEWTDESEAALPPGERWLWTHWDKNGALPAPAPAQPARAGP